MAEMGQVFNLGDVLLDVERVRSLRADQLMREQIMEERRAEAALKNQQLQQSSEEQAWQFQQPMLKAIADKAYAAGLDGDAAEQFVQQQQAVMGPLLSKLSNGRYAWKPLGWTEIKGLYQPQDDPVRRELETYENKKKIDAAYAPQQETPEQKLDFLAKSEEIRKRIEAQYRERGETPEERQQRAMELKAAPTYAEKNPQASVSPSKLTEAQDRSRMLYSIGSKGLQSLEKIISGGYDPTSTRGKIDEATAGGDWTNALASGQGQEYYAAGDAVISSILYKISGAVAGPKEIATQRKIYLPMPGDKPEVVKQKMDFMRNTIASLGDSGLVDRSGGLPKLPAGWLMLPNGRLRGPDGREYQR